MSSKRGLLLRGERLLGSDELGYTYHITICGNRRGKQSISPYHFLYDKKVMKFTKFKLQDGSLKEGELGS